MLKPLLCIAVTLATVQASGEFVVLHSPDSVLFNGNEEVEQSLLKEVLAAAVGYTVKLKGAWNGMAITNPFELPEAIVAIAVEGVKFLNTSKGEKFPLCVNEVEETTWQALRQRFEERDDYNTLVRISLGDGLDALGQSALGELKPTPIHATTLKALNQKEEEDKEFLEEVQLLHAIAEKVPTAIKADSKPDIYWLVVPGLRAVFDAHGSNSTASQEALSLLDNAINDISDAFTQAYDGQVLIVAFTNDASEVRHTRSANLDRQVRDTVNAQDDHQDEHKNVEDEEETNTNIDSTSESSDMSTSTAYNDFYDDSGVSEKSDQDLPNTEHKINSNTQKIGQDNLNLAKEYSPNYPIVFNIFLWFGVVFVFSLLAVCITIAQMDPGRDSIIYRMTSNRMKKDN